MLCLSYYHLFLLFNGIGEKSRTGSAWNGRGVGGKGGGSREQRGKMKNNKIKNKQLKKKEKVKIILSSNLFYYISSQGKHD
jgi:hypothetical protein